MSPSERQAWTDKLSNDLDQVPRRSKPREHHHTKPPGPLEFDIQKAFMQWVRLSENLIPELRLLHAIPNGGHRHPAVGGKMKAEGVRSGIPDLHLPVIRNSFPSLYLETKRPGEALSKSQIKIIRLLRQERNVVVVCFSTEELITRTKQYLAGEITDEQGTVTAYR